MKPYLERLPHQTRSVADASFSLHRHGERNHNAQPEGRGYNRAPFQPVGDYTGLIVIWGLFLAVSLQAQIVLVKPYVQPGDGTALNEKDAKVIVWMTDATPAEFRLDYGATPACGATVRPVRIPLDLSPTNKYLKYVASLKDLPLNSRIYYRVRLEGRTIRKSSFSTRRSSENPIQFVVIGDAAYGKGDEKRIAYQISRVKPEFMLIVGDIVYSRGRVSEYLDHFWNTYNNAAKTAPEIGAPLMQSVPIHAVIGNHDMGVTNLATMPDGFGAFYFFQAPLNGPMNLRSLPVIPGPAERVAAFKKAAGPAYPALNFYSFDNGAAHFLCLDANRYGDVMDPALREWIRNDLTQSRAAWKMAFFHQPGFHSSSNHYNEQKMRLLAPLFESCGVDVVFAGHVHNYQRSKPLRFQPNQDKVDSKGRVDGKFTLDETFDGRRNTRADGIIYFVTGGGGARLYNTNFTDMPARWEHERENWAPFTVKFTADRHSFTKVKLDKHKLVLRQIDDEGNEVDRIELTKPRR